MPFPARFLPAFNHVGLHFSSSFFFVLSLGVEHRLFDGSRYSRLLYPIVHLLDLAYFSLCTSFNTFGYDHIFLKFDCDSGLTKINSGMELLRDCRVNGERWFILILVIEALRQLFCCTLSFLLLI